jgi:hypothetical protein
MERVAHKSRDAREAKAWEDAQYRRMTVRQRVEIALVLKRRAYPGPRPDVRACHRKS